MVEPTKNKEIRMEVKPSVFDNLEKTYKEIIKSRKTPLLVMFYSEYAGEILRYDIDALEEVFDDFLKSKGKEGFNELDLLIHTHGGEAHTSYRLIQLIRSYCKRLNVLVSTHSHSGGTLIAFGADTVEMGRSATLSPIDIQIEGDEKEIFSLLSIEKYLEFLKYTSKIYEFQNEKNKTQFITELTKELVQEVCPSKLGELFRLRSLTELHSKALLNNYMLKNESNKKGISEQIISRFTKESPTHQFVMDYELVQESGLVVKKMDSNIYKYTKDLINILGYLERCGLICNFYPSSTNKKRPFFKIFSLEGVNENQKK
ncbi:MAG: hypothetical protein PHG05_04970 [Candidatus Nanoarchaeia archaeon]|nr:hypothetical protein [Candidatus Nanoarchaeia archaeon]